MENLGVAYEWRELNQRTHVACAGDAVVGVLYASEAWTDTQRWLEFWWLPTDDIRRDEVLFGDTDDSATTWERARRAAEWVESQRA